MGGIPREEFERRDEKRGWQEFLPSWFHAWQVVSLFLFLFFLLFEDQTRRTVYFIPNEFEKSVFSSSLSSSSTIWRVVATISSYQTVEGEGGGEEARGKIILLTFHASFPPITTPHSFSRKREIDLETRNFTQRVKLLCFAILRGVV